MWVVHLERPDVARRGGYHGVVVLGAAVGVAVSYEAAVVSAAANVIKGDMHTLGAQSVVAMVEKGSER